MRIRVTTDYDLDGPSPFAFGDKKTIRDVLRCDFKAYEETPSYYTIDGPVNEQIDFLAPFVAEGVLNAKITTAETTGRPAFLYSLAVPLDEALAALDGAKTWED